MPAGSCLTAFMEKYPDRCLDVGIAEGHAITYAAGIASNRKMKVVASIYSTFLQRALDNVFHDVCLQDIPLVIALDRAGLAGADGSTHNGLYDIGFLSGMPNMVICQPRNGHVLKELMESSFEYHLPTTIRYPNLPCTLTEEPLEPRPLGRGEIICRGEEIAIVALGHKITTALEVNALLNLKATIIDPIFVKPLDEDLFLSILSTHKCLITIEEHSLKTGLSAILNSFIIQHHLSHLQVLNFGVPEAFIEHGKHAELTKECALDAASIAHKIYQEIAVHDYCHSSEFIESACP
jgi:1-deoxy-D-xylulose-5-phosphate synthase